MARIGVTVAAFAYLFSKVAFGELLSAFSRISAAAIAAAVIAFLLGLSFGAARWRALFIAYGASHPPAIGRLLYLHMVGLFFNTFFPGAVVGDAVRGVATRDAFEKEGVTGSLALVLVERIVGVTGLLTLSGVAFALRPLPGVENIGPFVGIGLIVAAASIVFLALSRRYHHSLPGPIGKFASSLPDIRLIQPFILALILSVAVQTCSALCGYMFMSSINGEVTLSDALVVVPLAVGAGFFPLTVAGAGVREAAFVTLFAAVGVPKADALAGSLAFLFCQLAVASVGGVMNMVMPLSEKPSR
jgi:glycosyltransferase 2 family protein